MAINLSSNLEPATRQQSNKLEENRNLPIAYNRFEIKDVGYAVKKIAQYHEGKKPKTAKEDSQNPGWYAYNFNEAKADLYSEVKDVAELDSDGNSKVKVFGMIYLPTREEPFEANAKIDLTELQSPDIEEVLTPDRYVFMTSAIQGQNRVYFKITEPALPHYES